MAQPFGAARICVADAAEARPRPTLVGRPEKQRMLLEGDHRCDLQWISDRRCDPMDLTKRLITMAAQREAYTDHVLTRLERETTQCLSIGRTQETRRVHHVCGATGLDARNSGQRRAAAASFGKRPSVGAAQSPATPEQQSVGSQQHSQC